MPSFKPLTRIHVNDPHVYKRTALSNPGDIDFSNGYIAGSGQVKLINRLRELQFSERFQHLARMELATQTIFPPSRVKGVGSNHIHVIAGRIGEHGAFKGIPFTKGELEQVVGTLRGTECTLEQILREEGHDHVIIKD